MIAKNLYSILQLPFFANQNDIKKQFRRLAFLYHPDQQQDKHTAQNMKYINLAYTILSDPEKKRNYDQKLKKKKNITQKRKGLEELYFSGLNYFSQGDIFGRREQIVKDKNIKRQYTRHQLSSYIKARENLRVFITVCNNSTMAEDARKKLVILNKLIAIYQNYLRNRPM